MTSRYLEGEFAPLHEEYTLTDLEVIGRIPDHLDGRYLRNGANPIGEVDPELYHWFMGDGMVHGIRIRDGKAEWYRNRWVRGPQAREALGERSPARRSGPSLVGANTNVIGHAGMTLALMEGGLSIYELTDELDTVGVCDFDGTLTGGYTAHPHHDPETGELHAVSYSVHRGNTVQYSIIDAEGRARRTVDIEVTRQPDDARLLVDRPARRLLRPAGHVRRPTSRIDGRATRASAARPAAAVGLGRPGSHPGSHRRAPATCQGIRPAASRTRGTRNIPPASG